MEVTQLSSGPDTLVVEAIFPMITPADLFAYWVDPSSLKQWWPQEAEVSARVGGSYHLSWPQMGWDLRGRYTSFEPGRLLVFTWKWDHDEEVGEREVRLIFEPVELAGTRLLLTHGPYLETPEEQTLRIEHHLAGWKHFLPRLQQVLGDN